MQIKTTKSPVKAIRNMCMQCNGGPYNKQWAEETRNCVAKDCAIWHFRFGKNPYHSKSSDKTRRRAF